jgi:RNA polymerase sigma factor (TIGR02999 family)
MGDAQTTVAEPGSPPPVTDLLLAWGEGDESALQRLMPLVQEELHRLARREMRGERPGHTLQTTALVNEAYLRLIDAHRVRWQDRAHFFALSARIMRRILVDHARSRNFIKRGGGTRHVSLDEALIVSQERGADLVALDDALQALAAVDARKSQVVEMRFFGGLSVEETAEALRVSPETVMRDWHLAKVWLLRELRRDG